MTSSCSLTLPILSLAAFLVEKLAYRNYISDSVSDLSASTLYIMNIIPCLLKYIRLDNLHDKWHYCWATCLQLTLSSILQIAIFYHIIITSAAVLYPVSVILRFFYLPFFCCKIFFLQHLYNVLNTFTRMYLIFLYQF